MRNHYRIVILGMCLSFPAFSALADTFTVINPSDSGAGSLRQAILDANAHAHINASTPDTIRFTIPALASTRSRHSPLCRISPKR